MTKSNYCSAANVFSIEEKEEKKFDLATVGDFKAGDFLHIDGDIYCQLSRVSVLIGKKNSPQIGKFTKVLRKK